MENNLTPIISAFPGTGKTYYVNVHGYNYDNFCSDSDSSKFDKSEFPENYIKHIKSLLAKGYNRVFVSSHKEVRDALVNNGLSFYIVYPHESLKEEYLKRYKERGSSISFIELIDKNWDNWIRELKKQKGCIHIELQSGETISNYF